MEKVGNKIVDMLHKANPWAGDRCERKRCLLCKTKELEGLTNSQDCHKRNCVYQTYCITCTKRQDEKIAEKNREMGPKKVEEEKKKAKRFIYIGATNRSVFERGIEHTDDIAGCKTSSHMLRHLLAEHEEEEEAWGSIEFGMKVLKSTRSAFERQILESGERREGTDQVEGRGYGRNKERGHH